LTIRFTPQGCKVETTCVIQPNGTYTENVTLSVCPASALSLVIEESAGRPVGERAVIAQAEGRVRATKYGFELVERK
jgi:hypothetical protein